MYLFLGVYVFVKNPKQKINRVCAVLSFCFVAWSFGKIFIQSSAVSYEMVHFFERIACVGSFGFSAFFLYFALLFAKKQRIAENKGLLITLFIIPALLIFQQWSKQAIIDYLPTAYGWGLVWKPLFWTGLFFTYYGICIVVGVYFIFEVSRNTTNPARRKQARIIFISSVIGVPLGTSVNIVLPKLGFLGVPDLAHIVALIWAMGIAYAITKYKFLVVTPASVANNIISAMNEALILLDDKAKITTINPAAENLLGFKEEELKGNTIGLLFPEQDNEENFLEKIMKGEQIKNSDFPIKTKEGKLICVDFLTSILREEKNDTAGTICIVRDIAQRKKAEEAIQKAKQQLEKRVEERTYELSFANKQLMRQIVEREEVEKELRASQERLKILFEYAPDAYYISDLRGVFIDGNRAVEQLTGYDKGELVGKDLIAKFTLEEESEKAEKLLSQNAAGNAGGPEEIIVKRKDGSRVTVEIRTFPVKMKGDTAVLGIGRDVTERKKEEETRQKTERIESLGVLAGGIAHDFNNILTVVLTNLDLAKMYGEGQEKILERLIEAEAASVQAKNLTQQLLTFSKGGVPIKKTAAIKEMLKDVGEFTLRGSNVRGDFDIDENLSSVEIDLGQMSQVVQNLVLNGQQAMPDGGTIKISAKNITLSKNNSQLLEAGKYIEITISDHGMGVPEEHMKRIFDPYFTTKQKGSGLGLAVVFSVIEKHGGHINVKAKQGQGTTFSIYLPVSLQQETKKNEKSKVTKGEGSLLVMDDEASLVKALKIVFHNLGYKASFAANGEDTIKLYKEAIDTGTPFDVVILDLTIPGGRGGKEIIGELLKIDPKVRAIASSGYSTDPVMVDFQEYGFKGAAAKPYELSVLSQTIKGIMKQKEEE
ncbi:MAG: PAS domain S-box protein [Candidatus Omnitrophica bacterium]|nr:PAS domain S-box protein [Candidatus Omnitrophota bacterium]